MAVGLDDLRCEILGGAAEGVGHAVVGWLLDFGQTEIGQLQVALRIKKHILWLEISVDDTVLMEMLESQGNLSRIKARPILVETDLLAQMEEQLSTVEEVRHEVERLGRLEGVVQLDDERVRDLLHDIPLDLRVLLLVRSDDEVFLEGLDCVDLLRVLLARHVDFAEGAAADDLEQLEIFDRQLFLLGVCTAVEEKVARSFSLEARLEGVGRVRHVPFGIDLVGLVARVGHVAAVFTLRLHVARLHVLGALPFLTLCAGLSHVVSFTIYNHDHYLKNH